MESPARVLRGWWGNDVYRPALLIGGFLLAVFFLQGLPYWFDDYNFNFKITLSRSLSQLVWQWLSPFPAGGDDWGLLDRAVQFVVYKISYAISGYHTWPYLLFRSACYAGLGVMIYAWGLRLLPETQSSRRAALAAALFFLVTPGPVASLVYLADFAPAAELSFLILTFVMWKQIEQTPMEWGALWPLSSPEKRKWLRNWVGLSFAAYLGYKTKADLKLIPLILAAYIFLLRRRQWRLFAIPVVLMLVLAVPWHPGMLTKLPPFIPGSTPSPVVAVARPAVPSAVGYTWQSANVGVIRDFLWSIEPYDFIGSLKAGTLSLAGLLGPFLLMAMLAFILWRVLAFPRIDWGFHKTSRFRAGLFIAIWFGAMLLAVSTLPAQGNYFFRIRWGILTMVPVSILLAWIFGSFRESTPSLRRWAVVGCIALFIVQTGINVNRSVWHRRTLGHVMTAIDQVYGYVDKTFPHDELALWPDFLSYEYHLDASPAIRGRDIQVRAEDLSQRHTPNKTLVLSWHPSLWGQLDLVKEFTGCTASTLFDIVFPCARGEGAFLMRYIGPDATYQAAEAARTQGDLAGARKLYEAFLVRHPENLGARLNVGLVAYQQQDWAGSEDAFASVRNYFPAEHYLSLAVQFYQNRRYLDSVAAASEALKLRPDYAEAYNNIAAAYAGLRRWDEAIQAAERAVKLKPDFQLAKNNLAWAVSQKNLHVDGVAAEAQAKLAPTAESYLNLSLQYYREGKYQECIAAAKEALKLRPDYAEAYNNIAAGFQSMGRSDEAIEAAQKAIQLKPDFQLARNNLQYALQQKRLKESAGGQKQ